MMLHQGRKGLFSMRRLSFALLALLLSGAHTRAHAQSLLVPMDANQSNHLKAYGLTFWVIDHKMTAEWLLNYRAGAFVLPDRPEVRREAALRGVTASPVSAAELDKIH